MDVGVGVYVVTSGLEEYRARVLQARQTWAPDLSEIFFVSGASTGNTSLGIQALPCSDDEERGVCCKTILGLEFALKRFPFASWLVRAVDDTLVFRDQLAHELRVFDPRQHIYVGAPSVTLLCHIAKFANQCGDLHAGGGGGVVFSRPLAELLLQHKQLLLDTCRHDDAFLGHFLRYVLDVHVHALPGVLQEPRFWQASAHVRKNVLPPDCVLPFPPPVYSLLEDWGPVQPFAPIDVTRLGLVHSDPDVWPLLATLPAMAAAARRLGKRVLAYADSQGQRIVGPHFRGAATLGLCTYTESDRLASFRHAAEPPAWMQPI